MKKILSLLLIFALILSCKTDYFSELDINELKPTKSNFRELNAQRNFHGLVLSTNGNPISGARVMIGDVLVQTNSEGFFSIQDVYVNDNFAYVRVEKTGYVNGSRTIVPTEGDNRINIMMIPLTTTSTISSGMSSTVSLPNGTRIRFDGHFQNEDGSPYNGNVNVSMFDLAPSNKYLNELMPGSFLANNASGEQRIMETYGMVHVQLTGSSGQKLQIADGHNAEMTSLIDEAQLSTAPDTIPLWSFDETTGVWQEEGEATRIGNTYVGSVSHFSWWNYDVPYPVCTLNINVKNSIGQPVSNVEVVVKLVSEAYDRHNFTDSNGLATGLVPANEMLEIKVYNNCGKPIHITNVGPFPENSDNTLPDIILSDNDSYFIKGMLKTCGGEDVTNGIVNLKYVESTNVFQTVIAVVNNGAFWFNISGCNINQQFFLEGIDLDTGNSTGYIAFTGENPITYIGNLTVCAPDDEFINYQIDDETVEIPSGGFAAGIEGNGLYINSNQANAYFSLLAGDITSIGKYESGFDINLNQDYLINADGNNLVLQINRIGGLDKYIDFTINGTFTDNSGNIRTLSVTAHVRRNF